jgi:hypothetical protein
VPASTPVKVILALTVITVLGLAGLVAWWVFNRRGTSAQQVTSTIGSLSTSAVKCRPAEPSAHACDPALAQVRHSSRVGGSEERPHHPLSVHTAQAQSDSSPTTSAPEIGELQPRALPWS